MGVRRLGRGRLHAVERKGKDVIEEIQPGLGMRDAIVSATQHREGYMVTTDIVLDFGTRLADIGSGGVVHKLPIGKSGTDVSYVCKVTSAVFGTVTEMHSVCLEAPTDGTFTDYDIVSGSTGNGYLKSADGGSPGEMLTNVGANVGTHHVWNCKTAAAGTDGFTGAANSLNNKFIYFGAGSTANTAGAKGSCTITVETGKSATDLEDGKTTIRLRRNNAATGATVDFVAEDSQDYSGGSLAANKFNIQNATDQDKLAIGIQKGINDDGNFTATVSANVVTVTHNALTAHGIQTNPGIADAPGLASGITVSNFTGAAPATMTSGKFLLRFVGFMEPDDV